MAIVRCVIIIIIIITCIKTVPYIPDVWIYKTGIGSIQGTKRIRRTNNTRIKQTKLTHSPNNSVDAIINDVLR